MVEIVNPGWLAIVVDEGRYGYADIGVPPSPALDLFSYHVANRLVGNEPDVPSLEVMGSDFRAIFAEETICAITGAFVAATIDGAPVRPWSAFAVAKGSELRVREVREGLRYYIGFRGFIQSDEVMGSRTTTIECRLGGFHGRPLLKGDLLNLMGTHQEHPLYQLREAYVPSYTVPHRLRVIKGPEWQSFDDRSQGFFAGETGDGGFIVSTNVNRTGIRLDGAPLTFKEGAGKSIVSEGVIPGTIQVPGDGMPIIVLHERTIGGYARIGVIVKADLDRLAHLRPRDRLVFECITVDHAHRLWHDSLAMYGAMMKEGFVPVK